MVLLIKRQELAPSIVKQPDPDKTCRMKSDPEAALELRKRLRGWRPDVVGTLMFLLDGDQVLLIRKKRGHGAGKVNAPGGKVHVGESPRDCAVRETQEEVGITALNPLQVAELKFVERVDEQWLGFVFIATEFDGEPVETDEAVPSWHAIDAIPYDQMWEDDRLWLPEVLAGNRVEGEFLFERGRLVAHRFTASLR